VRERDEGRGHHGENGSKVVGARRRRREGKGVE